MASLKKQVLNTTGEMHAMQDGVTIGILFALTYVYPPAATVLLGMLGVSGLNKRLNVAKIVDAADELVRTEEIENNPEYFVVGFCAGTIPIGAGGVALGLIALPAF